MNIKNSCRLVVKVIVSLAFAGVFYTFWMAVAISVFKSGVHSSVLEAVLWLSAPAITAAGFAAGIAIFDRLSRRESPDSSTPSNGPSSAARSGPQPSSRSAQC